MIRNKLDEIAKKKEALKEKAEKFGKNAKATVGMVTEAAKLGVGSSKELADKAKLLQKKYLTKDNVKTGLGVASKGAEFAAKGANIVAKSLEKASEEIKKVEKKFRKDD